MINRNSNSFHPFLVWQIVKFDAGVLDSRLYSFNVIPKLNSPSTPWTRPPRSRLRRYSVRNVLSSLAHSPPPPPPHTHTSTSQGSGSGLDDRAAVKQPSQKQSFARAPLHTPLFRSRAPNLPVSELCFSIANGIDRSAGGWGASGR
jgi:hypothetical protein